ncbi:unnamed protein product [Triticum turgidum subsp. durum]|uniref:DYW domain-containing protein n=1 Tax=Triticum turgidum subsp. durum TaxID=4567 RepID=A0A9R0YQB0_TRITD|nr:unnamed protein product [Triticum turgidum subsp. durum]
MEAGERTAASWSALLAAYTKAGQWADCLESFGAMARHGWRPDESSMVSALSACAHLGAYDVGRSVHCALLRNTVTLNTFMETSLVDMYSKCGCIEKAMAVFDRMDGKKNEWTYSAMVSGLALHGNGRKALQVALDADDEEKRSAVAAHSQKLAMAFGLLSTPEGTPVRIVTNLRMSNECHAYSALISEIFGREVVVRDRNRFHRFRRGTCSCGNYW